MNKKEELKAHIIKSCVDGNMTINQASIRLVFSERHVKKLKARYKKYGASSILNLGDFRDGGKNHPFKKR